MASIHDDDKTKLIFTTNVATYKQNNPTLLVGTIFSGHFYDYVVHVVE